MQFVSRHKKPREEKGVTSALIIALMLVFIGLAYAVFQIVLIMGGASETRTAVESGVLNVGKEVFNLEKLKVKANLLLDERQFIDVADSKRKFSLTNINRVWGQSLLVALNVQQMEKEGTSSSDAKDHANKLFNSAKALSDQLSDKLNDPKNLYSMFNNISNQHTTNMLGTTSSVLASEGKEWRTSLVDRGAQSNIRVTRDQLPGGNDAQQIGFVNGPDNKSYVPGYKPIKVLDQYYTFVPFKTFEPPHLIDRGTFDSNTNKSNQIKEWEKPVPNAFSAEGKTISEKNFGQKSLAFVQTNPQRQFNLEIPYGFVKVHFDDNKAIYQINENYIEETYDFYPTFTSKGPYRAGVGNILAITFLGMEYLPPNLYKGIYALPGDHHKVQSALLQRCREIKQNCTQADVDIALNTCPLIPGINDYVIFRIKDMMVALPFPSAIQKVLEMVDFNTSPDGTETDAAEEFSFFIPNFTFPVLIPDPSAIPIYGFFSTFEFGTETWTPGSGYNGCLGELKIQRTTRIYDFGTNIKVI